MTGLPAALLSIAVIAAIVLAGGGIWLLAKRRDRTRALLMLVMALVLVGNVLVWTL